MVEVGTSVLQLGRNLVIEEVARGDGPLGCSEGAVREGCESLGETMPVLEIR